VIYWFAAGCECLDSSPMSPWPDWLLRCVLWKSPSPPPLHICNGHEHADKAIEGIIRTVSGAVEGRRNATLFWGACRLRKRILAGQIGESEASALLTSAALATGLPEIEVRRTITSAWRAV
jgi:hypothetical protein